MNVNINVSISVNLKFNLTINTVTEDKYKINPTKGFHVKANDKVSSYVSTGKEVQRKELNEQLKIV